MAVIDASVYVALSSVREVDHSRSWTWFAQAVSAQEPLAAPVILLAELAAALARGMADPALAHRVVQQLLDAKIVNLLPVTLPLAERAAGIAAECCVRGCDAIYIALAEQLGDCLVTLDRRQLERGARVVTAREP